MAADAPLTGNPIHGGDTWSARKRPGRRQRARRRDLILVGCFVALSALAAGFAFREVNAAQVPPVATIERNVTTAAPEVIRVQFVGDTLLGDEVAPKLTANGFDWPFAAVGPLVPSDVRVMNAEGPFTTAPVTVTNGKKYRYTADPQGVPALARHGVGVLALGNNHVMDAGPAGLTDTINAARAAGIDTFGAASNREEAQRPVMLRSAAGTVALVGFGENFGAASSATDTAPGMVTFEAGRVTRGAEAARAAGADWVVAVVHWGTNYAGVDDSQRFWAQQLTAAGYDMVVGSGPHVVQPMEMVNGKPVYYSIGNYVFGTPGRFAVRGQLGRGVVLTAEFRREASPRMLAQCLVTDNELVGFQPRPCDPAQRNETAGLLSQPHAATDGDALIMETVPPPVPAAAPR